MPKPKPKPPTARSVSATLRAAEYHTADFRRPGIDGEGYVIAREDTGTIRVDFMTGDPDLHAKALWAMRRTLIQKGWKVNRGPESRFLLVTAIEGQR